MYVRLAVSDLKENHYDGSETDSEAAYLDMITGSRGPGKQVARWDYHVFHVKFAPNFKGNLLSLKIINRYLIGTDAQFHGGQSTLTCDIILCEKR